jgi:hypothetical protein
MEDAMPVPHQLDESVSRLREARRRVDAARQRPLSLESTREWLEALTDVTTALSDIHSLNNESVHEKLHDLAARVGLKTFPGKRARPGPD